MSFSSKEFTRDIADNYVSNFVLFQDMASKLNKLQGILQYIMLAPLFSFNIFGFWNIEGKYSRNFMLALPISRVINSSDSYHQWRINIRNSMLAHPVFPKHYNTLIRRSRKRKKHQTFYARFTLWNSGFRIKEATRDITDNYVSTFVIF